MLLRPRLLIAIASGVLGIVILILPQLNTWRWFWRQLDLRKQFTDRQAVFTHRSPGEQVLRWEDIKEGKCPPCSIRFPTGFALTAEDFDKLEAIEGIEEVTFLGLVNPGPLAARLQELPITELSVIGPDVGDDLVVALARHPSIKYLSLERATLTRRGIYPLGDLPKLVTLHLNGAAIDDIALRDIPRCRQLERLTLNNTPLTMRGVRQVIYLPRLKSLEIAGTRLSCWDAATLFPRCRALESIAVDNPFPMQLRRDDPLPARAEAILAE